MLSIIGKLINQLRTEQNMSIAELSQRTGIKIEKIIDIENGKSIPSLGMIVKISRSLGSRLSPFLDGHDKFGAVVTRADQYDKHESLSQEHEHLDYSALARGKNDRHMEPMMVMVNNTDGEYIVRSEHNSEEFIFVVDGRVRVLYGEEEYTLNERDTIYFDSSIPHSIINDREQPSKLLIVLYYPF